MPFDEVDDPSIENLFPKTKDEHTMMLARCERKFRAAESWRKNLFDSYDRFYELAQSHAPPREPGQWESRVFVPEIFKTIQTILPRLVAQLPEPIVEPVEAEDEPGAPQMEELLKWAAEQADVYLELVKMFDSALRYGTGIGKVSAGKKTHKRRSVQPQTEPVMSQTPVMDPISNQPMLGPDQQPVMDQQDTGETQPVLDDQGQPKTQVVTEEVTSYVGPFLEYLNLSEVFVDPVATDFDNAEWVIHRQFKAKSWCEERIESGFFTVPPDFSPDEYKSILDDPAQIRLQNIGKGGSITDDERIEVWECWYRAENIVITTLNRRLIVRVVSNPYEHGELPFVAIDDHLNADEFYGTGEVHHLEGVQDIINAMSNQRVNEVRLSMEKAFYGDSRAIKDPRDLQLSPGKFIPVQNPDSLPLDQVFRPLEMGDVTSSAYEEVQFWQNVSMEVSGVSSYQTGNDSQSLNDTATGVALISEQGNTRFSFKLKVAELTGIVRLYRQFGALLQQFMPPDFMLRIMGPGGTMVWQQVDEAALIGAFDYKIAAESSAQTETVRKQTEMELFNLSITAVDPSTGAPVFNIPVRAEALLRAYGVKNIEESLAPQPVPVINPAIPPGMLGPEQGGAVDPNQQQLPVAPMNGNGQAQPQGAGYPA